MNLKLITAPASLPITLIEAKAHLGELESDKDDYITTLIEVATEQAEEITSRQLIAATYEGYIDSFSDCIELVKTPLISVDKIEYIPYGSDAFVLLDASFYKVNALSQPATIYKTVGVTYPTVSENKNAIKITFQTGYADANAVPSSLKQWMLLRIGTMFENHEEIVVGASVSVIQNDYNDYLITKYKVGRL